MPDAVSWERIRETLEARRAELNELIGTYPGPITGCDAQFNHMLEERRGLNAELARLEDLQGEGGDVKTPIEFIRTSSFLTDSLER